MRTRVSATVLTSLIALAMSGVLTAPPAMGQAVVDRPDCFFEPGDVHGVNVSFPTTKCQIVTTPTGKRLIIAKGWLPKRFSLKHTYRGPIPCFDGVGRVVATKSGRVTASCKL
jgi:hypothetical protein